MRLTFLGGRLHPGSAMHGQGRLGKRLGRNVDLTRGIVDAWLSRAKAVTCASLLQTTKLRVPSTTFCSSWSRKRAGKTQAYAVSIRRARPSSLLKVFFVSSVFSF